MFRLIPQQSLRPVLLLKVRNNKSNPLATLPAPTQTFSNSISYYQQRSNATVSSPTLAPLQNKVDRLSKFVDSTNANPESQVKYNHFQELLTTTKDISFNKSNQGQQAFFSAIHDLTNFFRQDYQNISGIITTADIGQYTKLLFTASIAVRTSRLSNVKNRDRDQKLDSNYLLNQGLRIAVLNLNDLILNGDLDVGKLTPYTLQTLFFTMAQYGLTSEIVNLWEAGVNSGETSEIHSLYFSEVILAAVLPAAYETKRFTYEEILHIYELNSSKQTQKRHFLLASMGKISILAQDYSKALDFMEDLMNIYVKCHEKAKYETLKSLSDLHLKFIGDSKDISISKHFFDKVVKFELPYKIELKVPNIVSLLENCQKANEPFESVVYFWTSTIKHYSQDSNSKLNARYSVLNNCFFKIFFDIYPELDNDALVKLKEMIQEYSKIKPIDETFLNTVITNCSWNNKEILEQLIDSYGIYNVFRTPVSYRICLKKIGQLGDYTSQEIVQKWNESLFNLDEQKYQYIPLANWSALRDATILSPHFSRERKALYFEIVKTYKDYMQDLRACSSYFKYWYSRPQELSELAKISLEDVKFLDDANVDLGIPDFQYLKKNVDYSGVTLRLARDFLTRR